jgi:50S ribosomal protein L16 3-hydroxylase
MNDPDRLGDWFGRFMTTYRASGDIIASANVPTRSELEQALASGATLYRHPWSRLAWRRAKKGATLFCSGLDFRVPIKDAQRLAAAEQIDGGLYAQLAESGRNTLIELLAQGHYQLGSNEDDDSNNDF